MYYFRLEIEASCHGPDLRQQLSHVVDELRDIHPKRAIVSDIAIAGKVFCDPKRVAQLLSNLLVNALIYGAPDQPVRVSVHSPDGGLFLSVSNGGSPITPETMSALFRPCWRGDNSGVAGGLGLGLYIVSEIARSHNGVIEVTSTPGATTFSFSMPPIARSPMAA